MKLSAFKTIILTVFIGSNCVAQDLTITTIADASTYQGDNTRNYGGENKLLIKNKKGSTISRKIFLKFDLQSTGLKKVKNATLKLYCNDLELSGDGLTTTGLLIDIYAIEDTWNENDITWKTAPKSTLKIKTFEVSNKKNWIEVNLTDYFKSNYPNLSKFSFMLSNSEGNGSLAEFSSKEGKNKPILTLE